MKRLVYNANVFDGFNAKLLEEHSIIIEDNLVVEITDKRPDLQYFAEAIDAGGRVVIPGLTDAHAHPGYPGAHNTLAHMRMDEIAVRSVRSAYEMLLRGFTTLRCAGGQTLGLRKSIDNGWIAGPRIYPSNAILSQTAGCCDFRFDSDTNTVFGSTMPYMRDGHFSVADGVNEVMKLTREQLFLGATQIKICGSGGFSSISDPLPALEWRPEEIKAVVDVAKDYGTYVFSHVYSDEAVRRAVEAGVMCIEHGQLMTEETTRMMADKGVWLCPCPQFRIRDDFMMNRAGTPPTDPAALRKGKTLYRMYLNKVQMGEISQDELIHKYNIPIVYGTDLTGSDDAQDHIENGVRQLGHFHGYKERYGSLTGLRAATGNVHELLKLCTYRDPYPDGKIGVLEKGSFADLCIVEGNPVEDLDVLCDPANMKLVMKDGVVYKNIL